MRDAWRKTLSYFIVALCGLSVLVALVPLVLVLSYVVSQGITALNWSFFTQMPKPVGEAGGGMANAIVGTLMVVGLGALFAVPVGILSGIYAAEYAGTTLASAARFAADTLNGVPSIVIGVFVYAIAVLPFKQFSALAGGIALGIMMIPLIMRTTEELLRLVPGSLKEGALRIGRDARPRGLQRRAPSRASRHLHRYPAGACADRGRNRPAALHIIQQSLLHNLCRPTHCNADRPGVHVCDRAVP